ncbi:MULTISPECIES: thioredoxin [Paenibacillus]|uniref:Thioredoxin n=1 Tax=Paenibacillus polymyxa (strain SC2) TaxID=886882 RepID=E3EGA3_PAEPS|nr:MULTISPECIES: thioredoxin [Paenibacillus]ADO56593.1 thioredoxin [Paenibacillus polymyxa SC2]AJE49554.1 thioredoxin [Paenibacillus polymyxa]KAF6560065.1 thioredoxin [Paenibacillus sp. EKM202P]KAF6564831.1 thioredoxin [Paenibacillus sp. EKM207P]MBU9709748.1 thioredoxin [Paenibacillus sp. AK121]
MSATALTNQTFNNQIQSGITLVDFWAPWCGPCQIQLPIIHQLADDLKEKATIATINVDEQTELATRFGIRSIPALLLFQDGKLMDTMIGINQRDVLEAKILKLMN